MIAAPNFVPDAILLYSHIPPWRRSNLWPIESLADRISGRSNLWPKARARKTEPPPTMLVAVVYCSATHRAQRHRSGPNASRQLSLVPSLARPVPIRQATALSTLTSRSASARGANEGASQTLVAYRGGRSVSDRPRSLRAQCTSIDQRQACQPCVGGSQLAQHPQPT